MGGYYIEGYTFSLDSLEEVADHLIDDAFLGKATPTEHVYRCVPMKIDPLVLEQRVCEYLDECLELHEDAFGPFEVFPESGMENLRSFLRDFAGLVENYYWRIDGSITEEEQLELNRIILDKEASNES